MPLASNCPECGRELPADSWRNDRQVRCRSCEKDIEIVPFPALHASGTFVRPAAAMLGGDATCFFHAANRAEAVCSACGRLLCPVCAVDFAGQCLCPSCIARRPAERADATTSRMLWDSIALILATMPILVWPFTVVTAPMAIGVALYGWNKPCSLVRGSRVRLVLALILGIAQVAGWIFGLTMLFRKY